MIFLRACSKAKNDFTTSIKRKIRIKIFNKMDGITNTLQLFKALDIELKALESQQAIFNQPREAYPRPTYLGAGPGPERSTLSLISEPTQVDLDLTGERKNDIHDDNGSIEDELTVSLINAAYNLRFNDFS